MYNHSFSHASMEQLATCHVDLQLIAHEALKRSPIDFIIREGHRSLETQVEYFKKGWTTIDPRKGGAKSKHMSMPSMAFDFKIYVPKSIIPKEYETKDFTFEVEHLTFVGAVIQTVAQYLYEQKKITHRVRLGMNWDDDGLLLYDHTLWDRPHVELIK